MGYLIFRNYSTANLAGVEVAKMPSHRKASVRYSEYYVKGRDGALHVEEGYSNFDLTATLVLVNGTAQTRQLVNAWADGTGKLITSDDLTHAYMASVLQEVEWSRVPANGGFYDTALITFNCQPFMVEAVDSVYTFTSSDTLTNGGTAVAYPLIEVKGSGTCTFSVNGEEITLSGMSASKLVYLDCANGYVWAEEDGAREMTGNFPVLDIGENEIVLGQNTQRLKITPHWRWV